MILGSPSSASAMSERQQREDAMPSNERTVVGTTAPDRAPDESQIGSSEDRDDATYP